jgi:hypothetical protein
LSISNLLAFCYCGRIDRNQKLTVCSPAHADLYCVLPIIPCECAGNWDRETPFGGKLGIISKNVVAMNHSFLAPGRADAKAALIKITETHEAVWIAVDDEIRQHAFDQCSVQSEVRCSARERANPLNHAVAVSRYLRAEGSGPWTVRVDRYRNVSMTLRHLAFEFRLG